MSGSRESAAFFYAMKQLSTQRRRGREPVRRAWEKADVRWTVFCEARHRDVERVVEYERRRRRKKTELQPNIRRDIEWVYLHLGSDRGEAPTKGADALWRWAREPENRATFFKDFLSKLMPTRAQIEREQELSQGGQVAKELIGKLLDACKHSLPASPEGPGGEPPVPAGAVAAS